MATSIAAATIGHVKLLRPLRERDFALLWTGMTVSLLGDGIFIVAEAWQVYDIDNDPVALSLVGLAWTGGMTAFLLTGGIVSDRVERRRVLIAADLVRALVLAVTGALSLAGVLEIWHLVALAVLYGAGEAFFGPAFGALVPEIVAPHHLVEANSLDQLVRQACERLLGPAVGGFVVAAVGPGGAFLIDAGTFATSAACIWALQVRSLPAPMPSARRAASCARRSPSCARSRGCGRPSWQPR
jgi:DHA3 family tetracycline resistance protein-like MFS transporter